MEGETRKAPHATLDEAAAFMKLSRRTLQNFQDQKILSTVHFGRRRFFKWAELERLAKTGVK